MVNSHHWQESEDAWAGQQKSNVNNWFTRLPWYDQVGVQATIGMNEARYWENDASEEKFIDSGTLGTRGFAGDFPATRIETSVSPEFILKNLNLRNEKID